MRTGVCGANQAGIEGANASSRSDAYRTGKGELLGDYPLFFLFPASPKNPRTNGRINT